MKNWIPIPGSVKAKILNLAVHAFSAKGYKGVHVKQLAEEAGVTTGAIYHHFGSKEQLYSIVREEMERRIIDRMEGAAAVIEDQAESIHGAILVGFDATVKLKASKLLGEDSQNGEPDRIEEFLQSIEPEDARGVSVILKAAFRSALLATAEERISVEDARNALSWLFKKDRR